MNIFVKYVLIKVKRNVFIVVYLRLVRIGSLGVDSRAVDDVVERRDHPTPVTTPTVARQRAVNQVLLTQGHELSSAEEVLTL